MHGSLKCLLVRRDTEEVVARITVDDLVVSEQDERYVVDLEGDNADMIMSGDTLADVIMDVGDSLCWYAHRAITEGVPFPAYDGVTFEVLATSDDDQGYEFMIRLPEREPADLVTA